MFLHDLVRQLVYAVVASGKHGLEAYGAYFLHALYHARFVAGQLFQKQRDALGVAWDAQPLRAEPRTAEMAAVR